MSSQTTLSYAELAAQLAGASGHQEPVTKQNVLRTVQATRLQLLGKLVESTSTDDVKGQTLILSGLNDAARQAVSELRIEQDNSLTNAATGATAIFRSIMEDLNKIRNTPPAQIPNQQTSVTLPSDIPDVPLVEGELTIGMPTLRYDDFIKRRAQAENPAAS